MSGSRIDRGRAVIPVPASLLAPLDPGVRLEDAVVILGAGCAGLTLAAELRRGGLARPIVLIDAKQRYVDDRVWSFWSSESHPACVHASATSSRWAVQVGPSRIVRARRGISYRQVRAGGFARAMLDELARAGNVRLRMGERVTQLVERDGGPPTVVTTGGSYRAHVVVDARGPRIDAGDARHGARSGVWLGQEFLGLRLRVPRPVFEPGIATLMDFRTPQDRGVRFLYVLPTSSTEGLVESVHFSRGATIEVEDHRARIFAYLESTMGVQRQDCTVVGEERGCIPMTDARPSVVLGERYYAVGAAGGAVRPSSGYAFLRIQRSAAALARAIVAGATPSAAIDGWRRRLLDDVFLRFLRDRPEAVPSVFRRMFTSTPSGALVRFLSDQSTLLDEGLMIAAMPKVAFLGVLAKLLLERARRTRVVAVRTGGRHAVRAAG